MNGSISMKKTRSNEVRKTFDTGNDINVLFDLHAFYFLLMSGAYVNIDKFVFSRNDYCK